MTVNYLANRVPQRNQEVTPYEAFYNKRPPADIWVSGVGVHPEGHPW